MIKEISLVFNILVYIILISVLFLKITDEIKRHRFENFLMILLMFWAVFVTSYLIKNFSEAANEPINIYDITFVTSRNSIIIAYTIHKLIQKYHERN
jgi:hypothetical protein